jgi:hypothetical protein
MPRVLAGPVRPRDPGGPSDLQQPSAPTRTADRREPQTEEVHGTDSVGPTGYRQRVVGSGPVEIPRPVRRLLPGGAVRPSRSRWSRSRPRYPQSSRPLPSLRLRRLRQPRRTSSGGRMPPSPRCLGCSVPCRRVLHAGGYAVARESVGPSRYVPMQCAAPVLDRFVGYKGARLDRAPREVGIQHVEARV